MFLLSYKKIHFMGLKMGRMVPYTFEWPLSKQLFMCVSECLRLSVRSLSSCRTLLAAPEGKLTTFVFFFSFPWIPGRKLLFVSVLLFTSLIKLPFDLDLVEGGPVACVCNIPRSGP